MLSRCRARSKSVGCEDSRCRELLCLTKPQEQILLMKDGGELNLQRYYDRYYDQAQPVE